MKQEKKEELTPTQHKYIATYIQRLNLEVQKIKSIEELDKIPHQLGMFYLKDDAPLDILKRALYHAMERKDLICTYDDTKNPKNIRGRCSGENHFENVEESIHLTDREQKKFDRINEKKGWDAACGAFIDKFNPKQKLDLVLGYDDDNAKLIENEPNYICPTCMEELNDNADGMVSCDMEI
jgi:hypothetical protein